MQIPKSWKLEYKNDGKWNDFPLYVTDEYEVQKNQYNMVHPGKPIITDALRLQIQSRPDAAVGILSIDIEEVKSK